MAQGDGGDPDLKLVEIWLHGGSKQEQERAEVDIARRLDPKLTQFFQRLYYRPQEIEDLKQKTLQRVFEKIETFSRNGRFSNWVMAIALNIHRDTARREIRIDKDIPLEPWAREIQTDEPNAERSVISQEKLNMVMIAMGRLTKQERRCLELYVEGYKYEDIAMIMGIEMPTCRTHVHNARKRLRKILGDLFPEDGFSNL